MVTEQTTRDAAVMLRRVLGALPPVTPADRRVAACVVGAAVALDRAAAGVSTSRTGDEA
jgi:hypothetical protein